MATVTVNANGDGTQSGTWTTTDTLFYTEIEAIASADDDTSTVLSDTVPLNDYIYFLLDDMPTDFSVITAVDVVIRGSALIEKVSITITVSIEKSDESTALTDGKTMQWTGGTFSTLTVTPTITGDTDKTSWDGARVRIECTTDGDGQVELTAMDIDITYTTIGNSSYYRASQAGAIS